MIHRRFIMLIVAAVVVCQAKADSEASAKLKPEAIEARIREHRMGELIVKTAPGAEVKVEQLRHEFWFGTAVSNSMAPGGSRWRMSEANLTKYKEVLAANFNAAVHENALKWHNCERSKTGGFDYSAAEAIYKFCADSDIVMRGHCIFWCTDRNVQGWVRQLGKEELRKVVKRRAMDVTSRFKGRIEEFDLNNELIFGNFYRRNLGDGIIKDMADWAKQGDASARLFLNEQGVLASEQVGAAADVEPDAAAATGTGGIDVDGGPRRIAAAPVGQGRQRPMVAGRIGGGYREVGQDRPGLGQRQPRADARGDRFGTGGDNANAARPGRDRRQRRANRRFQARAGRPRSLRRAARCCSPLPVEPVGGEVREP